MRRLFALSLALFLLPGTLRAQTVRGTVVERDSNAPVQGAMLVLIDSTGLGVGGGFSDDRGMYQVRAPAPGRYVLRAQRVGFRDIDSGPFTIAAGEILERPIVAVYEPVLLPAVTVQAQRQCTLRPDQGYAAIAWGEAKKALRGVVLTEAESAHRFQMRTYERRLQLPSLATISDSARVTTTRSTRSPYWSVPAAELIADGFVVDTDSGTFYRAPDAHVLLSDQFANAYCFRVAEQQDDMIGVSFEPASRNGPPAVQGTLWLDATTFHVRYLEYRYTRIQLPSGSDDVVGGRVAFEQLPSGMWIVRNWYIRMPLIAEREDRINYRNVTRRVLAGVVEAGGEVLQVAATSQRLPSAPPASAATTDAIRSTASDSARAAAQDSALALVSDDSARVLPDSIQPIPLDSLRAEATAQRSAIEQARRSRGTRIQVILRAEIDRAPARHVGDLVRHIPGVRVREEMRSDDGRIGLCVESRRSSAIGGGPEDSCAYIAVILDDVMMPPPQPDEPRFRKESFEQMLLQIAVSSIESIEYFTAAEAGARFGSGSGSGVLVIYTRGNGPYAERR